MHTLQNLKKMRDFLLHTNVTAMLDNTSPALFEPAAEREGNTLVGEIRPLPRMAIRGLFEAIRGCGHAASLPCYGIPEHITDDWIRRDGPLPLPMVPRKTGAKKGKAGYAAGLRDLIDNLIRAFEDLVLGPAEKLSLCTE